MRILRIALSALIVLALALFNAIIPFGSLLPAYALPARQEGELRIHVLSVGQGDCSLVEFPNGEVLVIDGGDGSWDTDNKIDRYIKALAPTSLSVVATHADSDHVGGLAKIVSDFAPKRVYLPVIAGSTASYRALLASAAQVGAEQSTLTRYDVIENASGAYLVCISPYSQGEEEENEASCVLYLHYMGVSALFTGDVNTAREARLAREYALDPTLFDSGKFAVRLAETDILKVSHHGAKDASSREFLALLSPETAIVSCGAGNSYSHPAGETLSRLNEAGARVYRTDELGSIIITIGQDGYAVRPHITE